MSNVKILDCTLRDGGYINNWNFGKERIRDIVTNLNASNVDIIELGFLDSSRKADLNNSILPGTKHFDNLVGKVNNKKASYVCMVSYGACDISDIEDCCNSVIDGIRVIFKKNQVTEALDFCKKLKEKGYKVYIQPVPTMTYSDAEILNMIEYVNEINPEAFSVVDTFGTMYKNDLLRMFYLIDNNLNKDIAIGFHSHNNLQLSFSNAQELLFLKTKRNIIIDSSVFGMGRGAGNLCTELLTQYINHNIENRYNIVPLLEIVDEHLNQIFMQTPWGYSVPYCLAAVSHCHPNYATHLLNKQTITVKDINSILAGIPEEKRTIYDKSYIEELYLDYQKHNVDDFETVEMVKNLVKDRNILILAPGKSIVTEADKINDYIKNHDPVIFSVNFYTDTYPIDMIFVGNLKRFNNSFNKVHTSSHGKPVVVTSNISTKALDGLYVVNYSSRLNDEPDARDNSVLMLLKLLERVDVKAVSFAGFDGFTKKNGDNYYDSNLVNNIEAEELVKRTEAIGRSLKKSSHTLKIKFITETNYKEDNS